MEVETPLENRQYITDPLLHVCTIQMKSSKIPKQVFYPCTFRLFIAYISAPDSYTWKGYVLVVLLFVCSCVYAVIFHYSFKYSQNVGMRLRSALTVALYRQVLKLLQYAFACALFLFLTRQIALVILISFLHFILHALKHMSEQYIFSINFCS